MIIKSKRITAAVDDEIDMYEDNFESTEDPADLSTAIDSMSDTLDDMSDQLEDIAQDDPNIVQENNISGHYIAECESCLGVFISSMTESEQAVESIHGICPICNEESDQRIKWVVHDVEYEN